jgi:hypothetical protein
MADSTDLLDKVPESAWTLQAEQLLPAPFGEQDLEHAVAAALPPGPWLPLLRRALVDHVVTAILYMQSKRAVSYVRIQYLQLQEVLVMAEPAPMRMPPLAQPCALPQAQRGWSFFLIEKSSTGLTYATAHRADAPCGAGAESPYDSVQVYLFSG